MSPAESRDDDTLVKGVGGMVQSVSSGDFGLARGALVVPSMDVNLLSVSCLLEDDSIQAVLFTKDRAFLIPTKKKGAPIKAPVPFGRIKDGQYIADNKGGALGLPASTSVYSAQASTAPSAAQTPAQQNKNVAQPAVPPVMGPDAAPD